MKPFDNIKVITERHTFENMVRYVKKVYIPELSIIGKGDLKDYFKKGLKAKKILKYQKDECSFRWVVWYI